MENDVLLEHAFLYVRNVDRSIAFYRRLMPGWTVRWEGHGYGSNRWIHWGPAGAGTGYLSLCEHLDPNAQPAGEDTISVRHIGFAHPDVSGLVHHRLAREGIAPSDRTEDDDFRRAYFEDPDGYQLEFVERLRQSL